MTTVVRISPFGIFCFVCGSFIVLYALKDFMSSRLSLSEGYTSKEIPFKTLLETSIYLAEKGGNVLKEIREKSDLQVCSWTYILTNIKYICPRFVHVYY